MSVYDEITQAIITELEKGVTPWYPGYTESQVNMSQKMRNISHFFG
jgi:antirestriction protein ArdC